MTVTNDDEPPDMRTRNKQAIREAIGAAALRLALSQGPGGPCDTDPAGEPLARAITLRHIQPTLPN